MKKLRISDHLWRSVGQQATKEVNNPSKEEGIYAAALCVLGAKHTIVLIEFTG